MKIALAQLNYHIGNFRHNYQKMASAIEEAKAANADLICFGELATCGYPPRDFLEFSDFINKAQSTVTKLAELADGIAVIVGSPAVNPVVEGKDLFNAAYFLNNQRVEHVSHKALLPTYDIFDEYRYFEPATSFSTFEFKGSRIALTVCEDIWNINNENPLYRICPMDELIHEKPDFMINISASPFAYDHADERIEIVRANARRYNLPVYYVNNVGAQTEVIFDGGSLVASANGSIVREMPFFEETIAFFETDTIDKTTELGNEVLQPKNEMALIHDAIVLGIKDYFEKLGFSKAVLGLSGGIDSAVTLALASEALGPENMLAVLMPSQFSSDHSINDAKDLAENLGVAYEILPIEDGFEVLHKTLSPVFKDMPFNLTEENLQARIRGVLLMAISNKHGFILLNTSNKSEAAVGYGTLYGDMCGGLSVIGDVYKTQVYDLARYINRNDEIIPLHTIEKAPSAELRPNQKDSDSLPDYSILDKILYEYIEKRRGPDEIKKMGYDTALVDRILRLVNINEFKRYQTAPTIRVSSKAFGMGRRLPIVARYLS